MAADNLLSKWAIWVEGQGKVGNAKEYTPPALEVQTIDFQAGDMDMPIPVDGGMAAMEASFALFGIDLDVLPLFGIRSGSSPKLMVRSYYTDRLGNTKEVVEELHGMITKIERDAQDTGNQREKTMKVTMKLDYYKVTSAGTVLVEISPLTHVRKLDDVDVLSSIQSTLAAS
ncbi:phage major tail tube protein [Vibrio sp. PP-XX7]